MPIPLFIIVASLLVLFPSAAEAAKAPVAGDRVLVDGRLKRKCVARVEEIPSAGFARLSFDRAGCGDSAQYYELAKLQHLTFVDKAKNIAQGDSVLVKGHFSGLCAGRVKEVTRSGYVAVDFDSLLCADTDRLYKAPDLTVIRFVTEATHGAQRFELGQRVSIRGIHEQDSCAGEILRLTDNGLASIQFDAQTCASASRLYPVSELKVMKAVKAKTHASGEKIFLRVMREIASAKAAKLQKRQARR